MLIALDKANRKLSIRSNRVRSTLTSGPKRTLFWTTFCQSTIYYATSVFLLSKQHLRKLQRVSQLTILGRAWIPHALLSSVLSSFRIGPSSPIEFACKKFNLGAVLRLYGSGFLQQRIDHKIKMIALAQSAVLKWSKEDPIACERTILNQRIQTPFQTNSSEHARKKAINKFLASYKESSSRLAKQAALDFVLTKSLKSPLAYHSQHPLNHLCKILQGAPQKNLPPIDRFYFLRWLLNEETEASYRHKIGKGTLLRDCNCGCQTQSRLTPFTVLLSAFCITKSTTLLPDVKWCLFLPKHVLEECHLPDVELITQHAQIAPSMLSSLNARQVLQEELRQEILALNSQSEQVEAALCPLCKIGEASIEHWLCFCPVVGVALSLELQCLWNVDILTCPTTSQTTAILAIRKLAALRRFLLTTGCMSPTYPKTNLESLFGQLSNVDTIETGKNICAVIKRLRQEIHRQACPIDPSIPVDLASCPHESSECVTLCKPALLSSLPQANAHKCSPVPELCTDVTLGQVLFSVHADSALLTLFKSPTLATNNALPVKLVHSICTCGKSAVIGKALASGRE